MIVFASNSMIEPVLSYSLRIGDNAMEWLEVQTSRFAQSAASFTIENCMVTCLARIKARCWCPLITKSLSYQTDLTPCRRRTDFFEVLQGPPSVDRESSSFGN
jgi:hypothetical protein